MPNVPQLDPQINQAAIPGARVDPGPATLAAGSAGLSDAATTSIESAGNTALDIYAKSEAIAQKAREKANTAWSQDLDNKALKENQNLLWDPQNGVYAVGKGTNAVPVTTAARVNYQKYLESLAATANNPEQKQMASLILAKRYRDFDTDLLKHETTEQAQLEKTQHEALINTYRSEAVLNYRNPQRVAETLANQEAAIKTYLAQNGINGQTADQAIQKEKSNTLTQIVKRYIVNNQDQQAKAFYEANKDGFTGQDVDTVEKQLEDGTKKGEIFRAFDTITSKYVGLQNRREAAAQMLKDKPEIRGEVDDKLVREQKIADMAQDDQRDQIYADTVEALANNQYDINSLPADWMRHLSPKQQLSVRDRARKGIYEMARDSRMQERENQFQERAQEHDADRAEKAAEKARKDKEESDWQPDKALELKYEVMPHKDLAAIPESFMLQNVEPYVSDQSWSKIKTDYARAREEAGKPPKSLRVPNKNAKDFHYPKLDDEVMSRLKAIPSTGIQDGDTLSAIAKDSTKQHTTRVFMDNLADEYKKVFDETGKYPNYDTRQKILDRLTTEATFKTKHFFGLFDGTKKSIVGLQEKGKDDLATPDQLEAQSQTEPQTKSAYDQPIDPANMGTPLRSHRTTEPSGLTAAERVPYLNIAKQGNLFVDPKTKQLISKDRIESRIVRADAARKRGASAREIIDILKKD